MSEKKQPRPKRTDTPEFKQQFTIECQIGILPQDVWFKFAFYLGIELSDQMNKKIK